LAARGARATLKLKNLGRVFGALSGTKPLYEHDRAICRVKSRFLTEICREADLTRQIAHKQFNAAFGVGTAYTKAFHNKKTQQTCGLNLMIDHSKEAMNRSHIT
jgi:hypothetical protein